MKPKACLIAAIAIATILMPSAIQAQLFRRRQAPTTRYVPTRPAARPAAQPRIDRKPAVEPLTEPAVGDIPAGAKWEILRMGDRVKEVGTGHGAVEQLFAAAVAAPPEDDSYKWYVSIVTRPGCTACAQLLSDFRRQDSLKAFANPEDFATSWSHFNVYDATDQTQAWRWAKIKLTSYPTLLLQPPLNRRFGDPKTVVLQHTGYDGNADALADEMRRAIRYYVGRLRESRSGMEQSSSPPMETVDSSSPPMPDAGADPPFRVPLPSPLDNVSPDVGPPKIPDGKLPSVAPVAIPIMATLLAVVAFGKWILGAIVGLLTGGGLTNVLLLILLILAAIRTARTKAKWLELLIDDATLARMAEAVRAMLPKPSPLLGASVRPQTAAAAAPPAAGAIRSRAEASAPRQRTVRSRQRARVVMKS